MRNSILKFLFNSNNYSKINITKNNSKIIDDNSNLLNFNNNNSKLVFTMKKTFKSLIIVHSKDNVIKPIIYLHRISVNI